MRVARSSVSLAATDLANHLACRHLTSLQLAEAKGELKASPWRNPFLKAMLERGLEHEGQYLDHLRSAGKSLCDLSDAGRGESGVAATLEAMQAGDAIIVQATLGGDGWSGIADVLQRVEEPSELGGWSYEAVDTKLARETSAGTILQLCLYSDLLASIQGVEPEFMHVIAPEREFEPERHRVLDYMAYYRLAKRQLQEFVAGSVDAEIETTYPEPVSHCKICRWLPVCDERRRSDDHLSLVAGISKLQRNELESRGITTLESLVNVELPLQWKPDRGSVESYERVHHQARIQLESRARHKPLYELLDREEGRGLALLPEPSLGDVFFDIEGDRFAPGGGKEYLFGYASQSDGGEVEYSSLWALGKGDERRMFESFIGEMMQRWEADPDFHIYHYAPYEPSTLKRLMGRYAFCEEEIDAMLRGGLFVDLYAVATQAIRAGVESYSIKKLEPLFGYERVEDLREVRANLLTLERALELGVAEELEPRVRDAVETYNRDDCVATLRLRDWLESLRAKVVEAGEPISRPLGVEAESSKREERSGEVRQVRTRLLESIPENAEDWSDEHRAVWRLAHMLEWHWREEKVAWWEYFRLRELSDEELLEDKAGIASLEFVAEVDGGTKACPIHRYRYPLQDVSLSRGSGVFVPDPLGEDDNRIGEAGQGGSASSGH